MPVAGYSGSIYARIEVLSRASIVHGYISRVLLPIFGEYEYSDKLKLREKSELTSGISVPGGKTLATSSRLGSLTIRQHHISSVFSSHPSAGTNHIFIR